MVTGRRHSIREPRSGGRAAWLKRRPAPDWLLAAVLLAAFEPSAASTRYAYAYMHVTMPGHVLWAAAGAVMTLSLAGRRRYPATVWAVSTACAALLAAVIARADSFVSVPGFLPGIFGSPLAILPAPLVALYTVARTPRSPGRLALAGSLITLVPAMLWSLIPLSAPTRAHGLLTAPVLGTTTPYSDAGIAATALITAWILGTAIRARSLSEAEAAALRRAAAEAEKAEHDRAVAAEERARIARELHDIIAHHISVVTLQAGAARLLAESGRQPSPELLRGIEEAGRQAMAEIRHALGVIRSSRDGAAPQPGLARLPELAAQMSLAGLTVTIDGRADALPASLDLTAYRIVQEGLANVARHSAARTARVGFCRDSQALQITVADPGPSHAVASASRGRAGAAPARDGGGDALADPGGHGLIGLRERVSRYGGQFYAGPQPGGGFVLRVTLPVGDIPDDRPAVQAAPVLAGPAGSAPAGGQPVEPRAATIQPGVGPALRPGW